jgi:hypothetical protein
MLNVHGRSKVIYDIEEDWLYCRMREGWKRKASLLRRDRLRKRIINVRTSEYHARTSSTTEHKQ